MTAEKFRQNDRELYVASMYSVKYDCQVDKKTMMQLYHNKNTLATSVDPFNCWKPISFINDNLICINN